MMMWQVAYHLIDDAVLHPGKQFMCTKGRSKNAPFQLLHAFSSAPLLF